MNSSIFIEYELDSRSLFTNPAPIAEINEIGEFELANNFLKIAFKENMDSVSMARDFLKPILRSWVLEAEITNHPSGCIDFKFHKAHFGNSPADPNKHPKEVLEYVKDSEGPLLIQVTVYPPYPITLFTEDMEYAWNRFKKASMAFGESIQSAAYFIATLLIKSVGKDLKNTSKALSIDFKVLKKLGELSSIRGDSRSSRKYLGNNASELTHREKYWIKQAVRKCLYHLGKYNAKKKNENVSMTDLIDLNSK